MEIIHIDTKPSVTNLEQLPRGTGARYLECARAHKAGLPLIALRWRRSVPKKFDLLIDYAREKTAPAQNPIEKLEITRDAEGEK